MSQAAPKDNLNSGHRSRLRERFLAQGLDTFADYEVVELLLTFAIPRVDVKPTAKILIKEFGNLRGILCAEIEALKKINLIGDNAATFLKFINALIPIFHQNELALSGDEISTIGKLMKLFRTRIGSLPSEVLEMVCFDAKLKIVDKGLVRLFEGSVNSANVDIRKIVETAIKRGASSIALAHNHPSGDPRPSLEDIRFTRKLSDACRPIDLNFIEHVIVGKNVCYSFRRDGRFDDLYDNSLLESRLRGRSGVAESIEEISDDPDSFEFTDAAVARNASKSADSVDKISAAKENSSGATTRKKSKKRAV